MGRNMYKFTLKMFVKKYWKHFCNGCHPKGGFQEGAGDVGLD